MALVAHLDPTLAAIHRKATDKRRCQNGADECMAAALVGGQNSQRVAIDQRAAQLLDAGVHRLGRTEHADRQVQQMNAGGGHRAGRCFGRRQAPVLRRQA